MDFSVFYIIFAWCFIALLVAVLFLNILGLPANWIILCLALLWRVASPTGASLGLWFWVIALSLAIIGEVLEFFLQMAKARRYGSSSSGTWAGMLGAIVGAILMAPLFLGLGAFIGALLGAWLGSLIMELAKGRPGNEAMRAAYGALLGRFLGTVCKTGIGASIIFLLGAHILPDSKAFSEPDIFNIAMQTTPYLTAHAFR